MTTTGQRSPILPWQAEPYRLWSLLDMKPFDTAAIAAAIANVAEQAGRASTVQLTDFTARRVIEMVQAQSRAQGVTVAMNIEGNLGSGVAALIHPQLLDSLNEVIRILGGAPLPVRFLKRATAIRDSISNEKPMAFDAAAARTRLGDFANELIEALQEPKFFHVSPEHRALYEQAEPPFGIVVEKAFPDSRRDVSAAARCLALDEWTACVMHLMRALESPLHVLADRVHVSFPTPMEFENWKNIVDQIESKVNAEVKRLEQTTKSHARNDALKDHGEAVLQFRHFKNMWRNNAAHSRDHYDEREAQRAFQAVMDFMQTMAAAVSKDADQPGGGAVK